ncbi:MAG TPA: exonuclease domain-containing protein [Tepidiformaceae bacterium]|nr:exonuclease domain-containing protein [Tepidiformaceae bacterium]
MTRTYVALDLETTGLDPEQDRIIEIGAVRFDESGTELETFRRLVNPGREIPAFIERFTGVTNQMVRGAATIAAAGPEIEAFVGSSQVVGHNIGFDLHYLAREGVRLEVDAIDTAELARYLVPRLRSHGLAEVARELDLETFEHHRALSDARMAAAVFTRLLTRAARLDPAQRSQLARFVGINQPALAAVIAGPAGEADGARHIPALSPPPEYPALTPHEPPLPVTPRDIEAGFRAAATILDGFEERPEQREMAEAVRKAFSGGGHYLIEAGTGVGKSLAYLLPAAIDAVRNGRRVVVSTNTIALQEQLLAKDIPALRRILVQAGFIADEQELRASLLKGRSNYLCLQRWIANYASGLGDPDFARLGSAMLLWLPETETGDRSELNLAPGEWSVWQRFSAQDADCLARQNRYVREGTCFLLRARKAAESAHILVVNHALLLADLAAGGSAIPEFDHLVIDEAHNLEDVATNQFGASLSLRRMLEALEGIHRRGSREQREGGVVTLLRALPQEAFGLLAKSLEEAVARCHERAGPYFAALGRLTPAGEDDRQLLTPALRHGDRWEAVEEAWDALLRSIRDVEARGATAAKAVAEAAVESADVLAAEFETALRRVQEVHLLAEQLMGSPGEDTIVWTGRDREGNGTLNSAPIEVGPRLWEELFSRTGTLVATSATLSANGDMSFAAKRLGLEDPETLQLGSPFDYRRSTLLAAVEDVPDPAARDYLDAVARAIIELTQASGGRALALFTSNAALRRVAGLVKPELDASGILALAQGVDGSPRQLTEQLRSNPRTLVLGTASFWEGIDIRGDALSLLIIARLPFGVPSDPVFKARSEQYPNPFIDYALPSAILRFRQGFGRLIRDKSDRGVVAVLDRRFWEKQYGKAFLNSLPECTRLKAPAREVGDAVRDWLSR